MLPEELFATVEPRDYLWALRRKRHVVILTIIAAVVVAACVSLIQDPTYRSTTVVLVSGGHPQNLFDSQPANEDPERSLRSGLALLQGDAVRAMVRERLGAAPDVFAAVDTGADVIRITASASKPVRAAEIANAYAQAFIDYRRHESVTNLLSTANRIQAKIDELQARTDDLNRQLDQLRESAGQASYLRANRDATTSQQVQFQQKLNELQVEASLQDGGARVSVPAKPPSAPASPRPVRNILLALAMGAILGVGLALVLDHLSDAIRTKRDLERAAGGLSILGFVPAFARRIGKEGPGALAEYSTPLGEAYRRIRTSIDLGHADQALRIVQITSPSSGEGKTTTAVNLAVMLAESGHRVIVVECDLRRPTLHKFVRNDNGLGLTSVLLGDAPLSTALQGLPGVPGVRVLASGPLPTKPAELLGSERTAQLLTALTAQADVLLLDCPPVLPVTDAAVLSPWVDAIVLVAAADSTRRRELAAAIALLRQLQAPLMGIVLNRVPSARWGAYDAGSPYSYRTLTSPRRGTSPDNPGAHRRSEKSEKTVVPAEQRTRRPRRMAG